MNIFKLLKGTKLLKLGSQPNVIHLSNHSNDIKPYTLFIARKGLKFDPHKIIRQIALKGANAIVLQDKKAFNQLKDLDITVALSDNILKDQALISSRFFNPSENLKVIGITGTNGKTSTSNILAQYLTFLGEDVGVIGTIKHFYKDYILGSGRTTPDSIEWFKLLKKMENLGAKYVVAEISSHALDQYRVYGTKFDGGIFTNLTQDHLDYHKNIDNYFLAKKKLADLLLEFNRKGIFVVNIDDKYGRKLYEIYKDKLNIHTYGRSQDADFRILDGRLSFTGQHFIAEYKGKYLSIFTKLLGEFNIYNISASLLYLIAKGYDIECLVDLTYKLQPIKGRFEILKSDFLIINDYAHTPDALQKILESIKSFYPNKIITVFGAGGNRDKGKRPLMGEIAEKYSDIVIITSDNPRDEDPLQIIEDIKSGMKMEKETYTIVDRERAIKKAIDLAEDNDVILIAGKGHETYQIIGDRIIPFDDIEVARKYLSMRLSKKRYKKVRG